MVRPRKCRSVNFIPEITYFKPQGVAIRNLQQVELTLDELEAMRLSDVENLSQSEAANKMDIHQSTFQRTLMRARKKVSLALTTGQAIKFQGGNIMPNRDRTGPEGKGPMTGRRQGRCGGNNASKIDNSEQNENSSNEVRGQGLGRGIGLGNGLGRGRRGGPGTGKGRGLGRRTSHSTND